MRAPKCGWTNLTMQKAIFGVWAASHTRWRHLGLLSKLQTSSRYTRRWRLATSNEYQLFTRMIWQLSSTECWRSTLARGWVLRISSTILNWEKGLKKEIIQLRKSISRANYWRLSNLVPTTSKPSKISCLPLIMSVNLDSCLMLNQRGRWEKECFQLVGFGTTLQNLLIATNRTKKQTVTRSTHQRSSLKRPLFPQAAIVYPHAQTPTFVTIASRKDWSLHRMLLRGKDRRRIWEGSATTS